MSDNPIPERYKTRYQLAKAQLALLPSPEDDPKDRFLGTRCYCNETIAFCEELGAAEAALSEAQAQEARLDARNEHLEEENTRLREYNETDDTNVRVVARECRLQDEATIAQLQQQVTQQAATLTQKQETIDGLFAEVDKFQQIIIKNEPVWMGSGYSPAQCLRLALESNAQKAALAQQAATISTLAEALQQHSNHDEYCSTWSRPNNDGDQPCSCGLDAALASLPK